MANKIYADPASALADILFDGMTIALVDHAGNAVEGAFVYLGAPAAPESRLRRAGGINLWTDATGHARFRGRAASGMWEVQIRDVPLGLDGLDDFFSVPDEAPAAAPSVAAMPRPSRLPAPPVAEYV